MKGQVNGLSAMIVLFAGLLLATGAAASEVLSIDCTHPAPPIIQGHLGLGTTQSPHGQVIDADSRSLFLNGRPWMPVSGEFHFSRYPRDEWHDALLKMKAGGLDVVSTYVFWIHHEEREGEWDWSGRRSLRDFVGTCRDLGLKVIVRMGPWSHGEARNYGFPDWVQARDYRKRRNLDPEFMALTEKLYLQIAKQLEGQLWKDGGPVVGIQLDNECDDLPYLFALKELARKCGLDVPLYTMTGWNRVPIPQQGLLPLFDAYPDGYWAYDANRFRGYYFFTPYRNVGDMDALNPDRKDSEVALAGRTALRFPYACCEIAGGMASSYERRLVIDSADCAAIALVKLGCGNNMPGYYMYQGGTNPEGKYSVLNEGGRRDDFCEMPIKDYDFMAPLGAFGQVREHYHMFRQQHLFLKDWGHELALMPAIFPKKKPKDLNDVRTVRWSVRSDGVRGFLFFNNYQRLAQLPPKKGIQFLLKMRGGDCLLPSAPITIPSGAYGFWPINMDCGGLNLAYATAQPLCRLDDEGAHWFFFAAIPGVEPEFMIGDEGSQERVQGITPGKHIAFTRVAPDRLMVHFVVLTPDQALQLWKIRVAGRTRAVLLEAALLPDSDRNMRVETLGKTPATLAVLPPVKSAALEGVAVAAVQDGVFQRFTAPTPSRPIINISHELTRRAGKRHRKPVCSMDEEEWKHAAVWRLQLPGDLSKDHVLRIQYRGDVARFYAGGNLVSDNFCNGSPFDVGLWRIPADHRDSLEIHVLPPARIFSIKAIPRKQWSIVWEAEAQ